MRLPLLEDPFHPALVALAVEVGIRLVVQLVLRLLPLVRLVAVLGARRRVVQMVFHVVRLDELLLQFFPFLRVRLQRETVREEIVGRRILVHSAHEIADGVQEVLFRHHGRVEDDVVAKLLLSAPDVVGHALQHLEAEAVFRCLVHLREQVGVGDGEEVVRRHADV